MLHYVRVCGTLFLWCLGSNFKLRILASTSLVFNLGVICLFSRVVIASDKNIYKYFSSLYIIYGTIFVVAKIIKSPVKNDALFFNLKLFCDYDDYKVFQLSSFRVSALVSGLWF